MITGDVTSNGTLAFNRSDAVSFAGTITGTGGMTQQGCGTTSLTNAYKTRATEGDAIKPMVKIPTSALRLAYIRILHA